jgi:hypothetical protein
LTAGGTQYFMFTETSNSLMLYGATMTEGLAVKPHREPVFTIWNSIPTQRLSAPPIIDQVRELPPSLPLSLSLSLSLSLRGFAGVRTGPHASSRMPCVGVLGRLGPPSVEAPTWGKGRGEFSMFHFVVLSLCTFLLRLDRLSIVVGHYQAARVVPVQASCSPCHITHRVHQHLPTVFLPFGPNCVYSSCPRVGQ